MHSIVPAAASDGTCLAHPPGAHLAAGTAPALLPSSSTLTARLLAPCYPPQAISLPPVCAREGVAEMVVWPPFGRFDPLQRAQVQCQGGHAVLNLFGDGLPRQIRPDGVGSMLFTWGKVRIGHMASAC